MTIKYRIKGKQLVELFEKARIQIESKRTLDDNLFQSLNYTI